MAATAATPQAPERFDSFDGEADGLVASTAMEGSAGGGSDDIHGRGDQGRERLAEARVRMWGFRLSVTANGTR